MRFESSIFTTPSKLQGVAVMNFTDTKHKYTRKIQHWYFNPDRLANFDHNKYLFRGTETLEYPVDWKPGDIPYYPVNNEKNNALYQKYKDIKNDKVEFVGRLGQYKYYDMDDTIEAALKLL